MYRYCEYGIVSSVSVLCVALKIIILLIKIKQRNGFENLVVLRFASQARHVLLVMTDLRTGSVVHVKS